MPYAPSHPVSGRKVRAAVGESARAINAQAQVVNALVEWVKVHNAAHEALHIDARFEELTRGLSLDRRLAAAREARTETFRNRSLWKRLYWLLFGEPSA